MFDCAVALCLEFNILQLSHVKHLDLMLGLGPTPSSLLLLEFTSNELFLAVLALLCTFYSCV